MCYKNPGPRCTSHALKQLEKAHNNLQSARTEDEMYKYYDEYREAEAEYDATLGGQRALMGRLLVFQGDDEDAKAALTKQGFKPEVIQSRLERGILKRESMLSALKREQNFIPSESEVESSEHQDEGVSTKKNPHDVDNAPEGVLSIKEVRNRKWYHATTREDWFNGINTPDGQGRQPLVHLGSREAALDRATQMSKHKPGEQWVIYEIDIAPEADIHQDVAGDDNGYAPYYAGDEKMVDNYTEVTRYVNEFEDKGNVSLLANPSALQLSKVEPLAL